jgi:hypothetical protein
MEHIINEANSIRNQIPNHMAMLDGLKDKLEVLKAKKDKDREEKAQVKELEEQVAHMEQDIAVANKLAAVLENVVLGRFGTVKGMLS